MQEKLSFLARFFLGRAARGETKARRRDGKQARGQGGKKAEGSVSFEKNTLHITKNAAIC
jgi:hypothetical protein